MSIFWNIWIIGLTGICLALVTWVLFANRKVAVSDQDDPENRTTGHVYDGIEEYDNPLPLWWFYMFIITIIFGLGYLVLYPGLGSYPGLKGWTSVKELRTDQQSAVTDYEKSYGKFMAMSIEELARDPKANKMGVRLFANNCALCHGADGGGNFGFPNLTDKDWLYGGQPEQILHTLKQGRNGAMPAWGPIIGPEGVNSVAEYVLKLSGQPHDEQKVLAGKSIFVSNCAACHGADGKGNISMGAPNLTDDIWLYDGSLAGIRQSVSNGRANHMPAQKEILREDKIHVLAAYVYSLSMDYDEE